MRKCMQCWLFVLVCGSSIGHAAEMEGTASVSGGAATYSIPIELPGAAESFAPVLSISYSSRTGNGALGQGWTLSSVDSAVFRCPATVAQDGYAKSVDHGPADRLCLDGQRLVLASGEYGKDGSSYRLEVDSGLVVTLEKDIQDPQSTFTAIEPDGGARFFTQPVFPVGAPSPLRWLATEWANPKGNRIFLEYVMDEFGEVLVAEIEYGGDAGRLEAHFVRFEYAPLDQIFTSWLGKAATRQAWAVERLQTGTRRSGMGESLIREYRFDYRTSEFNGRLLLDRIASCEAGSNRCAEPIRVQWLDKRLVFAPSKKVSGVKLPLAASWTPAQPRPQIGTVESPGDLDADGRRDLLAVAPDATAAIWTLDHSNKVASERAIPADVRFAHAAVGSRVSADFHALGKEDLIGSKRGSLAVVSLRKGQVSIAPGDFGTFNGGDAVRIDAGSRGSPDLLVGDMQAAEYVVTLRRSSYAHAPRAAMGAPIEVARLPKAGNLHLVPGGDFTAIMDGDRVERVLTFNGKPGGGVTWTVRSAEEFGIESDWKNTLFADVNGDGLSDRVGTNSLGRLAVQVNIDGQMGKAIDTGVPDPRQSPIAIAGTIVADVDGDGFDDLLYPAKRLLEFCVRQADGPLACSEEIAALDPRMDFGIYEYHAIRFREDATGAVVPGIRDDLAIVAQANRTRVTDLGGDGNADYFAPFDGGVVNGVFRDASGALSPCPPRFGCGLRVGSPTHLDSRAGKDPALPMVKRVSRSPREYSEWGYYTLANPVRKLYSTTAIDSPERFIGPDRIYFTSSMVVVGELVHRGSTGDSEVRFEYGDGVYNLHGRGFAGFKWIVAIDNATGERNVSWFHQAMPYWGELAASWVEREPQSVELYAAGQIPSAAETWERVGWNCKGPAPVSGQDPHPCAAHPYPWFTISRAAKTELVSHADLRARFPEPQSLSEAKSAWERANARFLALAADGGKAKVEITSADGSIEKGEDEYLYTSPQRSRERRSVHEWVTVGPRACRLNTSEQAWECFDDAAFYDLRDIDWDSVVLASTETEACPTGQCQRIELQTALVQTRGDDEERWFASDPDQSGSKVRLLVDLRDHRPISLRVEDTVGGALTSVSYTYLLDEKVESIELPPSSQVKRTK